MGSALISKCAWCNALHGEDGELHSNPSEVVAGDYTHGICPDCKEQYFSRDSEDFAHI
jgi:hypothetical protein